MRIRDASHSLFWMATLVGAAMLLSFVLACGMPFAAIAALAALTLAERDAYVLAGLGWLTNQAVGFGFLGYPFDAMTLAWGAALGISAVAAVGIALIANRALRKNNAATRFTLVFLAAWAAQQGTIYMASFILTASMEAFSFATVWFIFWTNAVAFAVLLAVQATGAWLGLSRQSLRLGNPQAAG